MAGKYSTVIDSAIYSKDNLCPGIDLRLHVAGDLEEVGAFRAQEDWRRLVGPLEKPYRGGLGPQLSFITASVPECIPERLEITSYALEFGFLHDDVIDQNIQDASLDEMEEALEQGGQTGEFNEKRGSSGKREIATQILREMMAIDKERAMVVAKSWASGVQHSSRRQDDTDFETLEEYIPYRSLDVGYMLWHGLVTFCCAITIPEEEAEEVDRLLKSALITASLTNDLYSFEKERNDANVQNAVLVVMNEHGCNEEKAREILKQRIRIEVAKYVRVVKETWDRTDLSEETKRYIDVMQYTLSGNAAWSTQCPRYHANAQWNELQLLRAKYGVAKYPARWPREDGSTANGDGLCSPHGVNGALVNGNSNGIHVSSAVNEPTVNGNGTQASNGVNGYGSGHREPSKINGYKRKRNGSHSNGRKDAKSAKSARTSQPNVDSLVLEDVVTLALDLNLPDLSDSVVLQPYRYLTSLPSKGFRDQAIDSLNTWLKVPAKSSRMIKEIIQMLHSASLMLDDLEDGSPLRRGKPSTHNIYGAAQTINSATYQYTQATAMAAQLSNPSCFGIFTEEIQHLYVGQSYDLYWTHNAVCPSVSEYLKMVDKKTGGLFRMLTRLMVAESPFHSELANNELDPLSYLIGRFFQIRDDYQNLASVDYAKQKGFAEDLDEGKYSFTLIHCIQTLESEPRFVGDAMHLQAFLMKRKTDEKLTIEAKREVLALMKKTKSLDHTLGVLRELQDDLEKEVESLESRFGEENFSMRMMVELLKV